MQIQKEESERGLYQLCLYPVGVLPGSSLRQCEMRKSITARAKRRINKSNTKRKMMQQICANIKAGRDLHVRLTYREATKSEGQDSSYFYQRYKRAVVK